MNVVVRAYRPTDYEACRALWAELTQRHRDVYEDPTIGGDDPGRGFDQYLARPDLAGMWVAEVEGQVAGLAGLLGGGEEAEVEPVVVAAPHRSQGIGRLLVERAVEEARVRGVRFLGVRPVARNVEAISFFVEQGFRLLGYVDLFQDLAPASAREWKDGITIHGHVLRY
jgi:GNAT superfamily N-acetyltransferase